MLFFLAFRLKTNQKCPISLWRSTNTTPVQWITQTSPSHLKAHLQKQESDLISVSDAEFFFSLPKKLEIRVIIWFWKKPERKKKLSQELSKKEGRKEKQGWHWNLGTLCWNIGNIILWSILKSVRIWHLSTKAPSSEPLPRRHVGWFWQIWHVNISAALSPKLGLTSESCGSNSF